jgi:hypothetical protein
MAFSEKDPKDVSKERADPPKLDAILPDDVPASAAELVDDIATYQQRMEKDWESAKIAYENKINRIMNEFISEGLPKLDDELSSVDARAAKPSSPSRNPGGARLQDLIHQLEKELRGSSRKSTVHPGFLSPADPEPMQLGWTSPARRFSMRAKIAAGLAAISIAGIFFWSTQWRVIQTPIPYAHTLGPIIANHNIYIMDWFRKMLFVHKDDAELTIKSVETLPNNLATGIAMSEKTLWSLDGLDLKLNLHTTSVDHQVTSSVAAPDTKPVGLFFDGTDLWSADQDAYKLYRHRGNDVEEIRDTFPLPDMTITSFLFKKTQLWILDGKSRLVLVYRLQKPLLKLASYDLDSLVKQASPTGMALDGNTLLIVTENPASLVRIPLFRLHHSHLKTTD